MTRARANARVALIDENEVIERILRHLGLSEEVPGLFGIDLPSKASPKAFFEDPFPDYGTRVHLIANVVRRAK